MTHKALKDIIEITNTRLNLVSDFVKSNLTTTDGAGKTVSLTPNLTQSEMFRYIKLNRKTLFIGPRANGKTTGALMYLLYDLLHTDCQTVALMSRYNGITHASLRELHSMISRISSSLIQNVERNALFLTNGSRVFVYADTGGLLDHRFSHLYVDEFLQYDNSVLQYLVDFIKVAPSIKAIFTSGFHPDLKGFIQSYKHSFDQIIKQKL